MNKPLCHVEEKDGDDLLLVVQAAKAVAVIEKITDSKVRKITLIHTVNGLVPTKITFGDSVGASSGNYYTGQAMSKNIGP